MSFCLSSLEYCARYGVRSCLRHLYYLSDLLDRAEQGFMIDPQLLHFSYVLCASHVSGSRSVSSITRCVFLHCYMIDRVIFRPDSTISTITLEERDRFNETRERLRQFLESQVTNFRCDFLSSINE